MENFRNRVIFVTAFGSNHLEEGLGVIGHTQHYFGKKKIIFYDIGLSKNESKCLEFSEQARKRALDFNETTFNKNIIEAIHA